MSSEPFQPLRWSEGDGAIYRQLAGEIQRRIHTGELKPGDRLPPQRELAAQLGINLTTVTRAFAELQARGLVTSRAGRGSMIAGAAGAVGFASAPQQTAGLVDLGVNRPATTGYLEALAPLLARLPKDARYASLQDFHPAEGPAWAREAVVHWLAGALGERSADDVIVTNGAQSALACVLGALAQRGDVVLADEVTYQGLAALCRTLDVQLLPVATDRDGMLPDALEAACRQHRPRLLFLVPCLHNPTTVTLSETRRAAIAQVAERFELLLIEDDVYRPLVDAPAAPFAARLPRRTVYITSLSKAVAPGLRYGAVIAPAEHVAHIAAMQRVACWSTSPLNALIATRMIEDGSADAVIEGQKAEFRVRQALLAAAFAGLDVQAGPTAPHAWLHLPAPWRAHAFAAAARERGVAVLPSDAFAIGQHAVPQAVRINVGAARSHADLRRALAVLADVSRGGRQAAGPI